VFQVILAAIVAIWFFQEAGRVNLHQGKWVFAGLTAYLVPSILWAAFFVLFLRKPVLEAFWRYDESSFMSIAVFFPAAIGPVLGFVSSYALNRKYLTAEAREAAMAFEHEFKTKAVYSVALILMSVLILLLAAKYAPEVNLESKFNYKLF